MILQPAKTQLEDLGSRLRTKRIERGDTQAVFAARIGVGIATLRRMETGDPTVQIGYWANALDVLGRLSDIEGLLPDEDLFAKYDRVVVKLRRRVNRKRKSSATTEPLD